MERRVVAVQNTLTVADPLLSMGMCSESATFVTANFAVVKNVRKGVARP